VEAILQQILEEIQGIKKEQTTHSQELKGIKEQLNNMQGQLAENTRFIHALSQDVAKTATREDLVTLSSGIEALNTSCRNQSLYY
jgi:chromosome segregation ATPase